jgi:hypothetical protein
MRSDLPTTAGSFENCVCQNEWGNTTILSPPGLFCSFVKKFPSSGYIRKIEKISTVGLAIGRRTGASSSPNICCENDHNTMAP